MAFILQADLADLQPLALLLLGQTPHLVVQRSLGRAVLDPHRDLVLLPHSVVRWVRLSPPPPAPDSDPRQDSERK